MARSEVTVTELLKYNTGYVGVGDAIDLTNDHSIDVSDIKDENLLIVIENATTETGTATIVASAAYSEYTQGDLVLAIGASETMTVALESSRFKTAAGLVLIDMASAGVLTGKIYASRLV